MDERYAAWAARWRVPLGFAFGIAYLIFSQPTSEFLVAGGLVALSGLMIRAVAAGYLEKNVGLATGGPYTWTRNPLYLGSFVMGMGFALAGGSWLLGLGFISFFFLVYWPVMRREEDSLRKQFGEPYERYANAVPFFLPSGRRMPTSDDRFRWKRYQRNREYRAAFGFLVGLVFLTLKLALR